MEMSIFILINIVYLCTFETISASEIPVLLWTNKGEIQYPVTLSGHTLGKNDFINGYLDQMTEDVNQNVAIFLQDKLSLEDITQYGDVYNDQTDGAVLSSVRSIFETYESTHLPSVKAPADAISLVQKKFKGKVHIVESEDDVAMVPLEKGMANLVIVNLPKSVGINKKNALKQSDGIIGKLTQQLADEERPFSAVYTAQEASKPSVEDESSFKGRHLLAEADTKAANTSYTLFKVEDCVLLYFHQMSFTVTMADQQKLTSADNGTFVFPAIGDVTESMITNVTCSKNTSSAHFSLDFKDHLPEKLTEFSMSMSLKVSRGYWMIDNWTVSYTGTVIVDGKDISVQKSQVKMDSHNDVIYGTIAYSNKGAVGYSYFCGNQPPIKQHERNPEKDDSKTQGHLTFKDIQLQYLAKNSTFGPPNHCATLFTGAIWASIVVMLLMTMILAFGVMMIMNITTMDRFDDPKGKTIQVNVSE